jgi:hypothetical protein
MKQNISKPRKTLEIQRYYDLLPSHFYFQIYGKRLEGKHICINYFIAKSNF